jgi:hypothetical protein
MRRSQRMHAPGPTIARLPIDEALIRPAEPSTWLIRAETPDLEARIGGAQQEACVP